MKKFTSQEIKEFVSKPLFDEKVILNKDPSWPKVSIVTVSYNPGELLEQTILSVLNQNYPNLEYIIIDGGSMDGSVDIIRKYEKYLAYWISERDNGIYDAMNKGIDVSTGDIINFLNCGDLFYDNDVLKRVAKEFQKDEKIGIVYSATLYYCNVLKIKYIADTKIDHSQVWKKMPISHQSMFFKKELFDILGKYNTKFKIVADYEFLLRFIFAAPKYGYKEVFINTPISKTQLYGFHSRNYIRNLNESKKVVSIYFNINLQQKIHFWFLSVKLFLLYLLTKTGLIQYYRKIKYNYWYKKILSLTLLLSFTPIILIL